jgi:hypothetical protein
MALARELAALYSFKPLTSACLSLRHGGCGKQKLG